MQFNYAAVVYRLHKASESSLLPSTADEAHPAHRGYAMIRHRVTEVKHLGRSGELWIRNGWSSRVVLLTVCQTSMYLRASPR